jgi:glycosyltransferase involved in cell wall biosynthesis
VTFNHHHATPPRCLSEIVAELHAAGIRRIESYAWRDLNDPESGGSEIHADEILGRWAEAGLEIHHRTSTADSPRQFQRRGYQVTQRGGRMSVFARVAGRKLLSRTDPATAVVEIWNGVPWGSPIWHRGPRVIWLHHVHDQMWNDVLPRPIAWIGRLLETRIAPVFYRRSQLVTLADSSAQQILRIGIPPQQVAVIPPGLHPRFTPDPSVVRDPQLVVVVARLAPVKRIHLILEAVQELRTDGRDLRVEVIGDGPLHGELNTWITTHQAKDWVTLRGRVEDADLVAAYQRARIVASASHAEGWGMSLTEAAACGTPAVATDIAGHRGAVLPGISGELVSPDYLAAGIDAVMSDPQHWSRLSAGALAHAAQLSWDRVAAEHLEILVAQCRRRSGASG